MAQSEPREPAGVPEPDRTRSHPVREGHLPVSELAFDRPGAASPFGDDVDFPLPAERLTYTHTVTP